MGITPVTGWLALTLGPKSRTDPFRRVQSPHHGGCRERSSGAHFPPAAERRSPPQTMRRKAPERRCALQCTRKNCNPKELDKRFVFAHSLACHFVGNYSLCAGGRRER